MNVDEEMGTWEREWEKHVQIQICRRIQSTGTHIWCTLHSYTYTQRTNEHRNTRDSTGWQNERNQIRREFFRLQFFSVWLSSSSPSSSMLLLLLMLHWLLSKYCPGILIHSYLVWQCAIHTHEHTHSQPHLSKKMLQFDSISSILWCKWQVNNNIIITMISRVYLLKTNALLWWNA